jgi:hypothetical protein
MPRLRAVLATMALTALVVASTATAHQGNPDYRSVIGRVTPAVPGVKLQVLQFDDRLALQNTSGKTVVIQGYNREPYARVLANGTVEVNQRSPAYYLNTDRTADVKVPASANADAPPQWKVVDRSGRFEWHDHRIHWMGQGLPPPQVKDKSKRTKVFAWQVPVQIGAAKGDIAGTLYWQPKPGGGPPVGAIAALVAIVALGLGVVAVVRRRRGGGEGAEPAAQTGAEAW